MPTPVNTARKRRLGELLVEAGLIDEVQLKAALAEQRKWGGRLGRTIVEMGFATEESMGLMLAQQLQLQTVDLDKARLPDRIVEHLRLDLSERYGVFPVQADMASKTLHLATSDPTNVEALQELEFATNMKVVPVVATASAIDRAIRRYYFGESTVASKAATPQDLGVDETMYELDQLLGRGPSAPRASATRPPPPPPPSPAPMPVPSIAAPTAKPQLTELELQLRREIALLREQVDTLEKLSASQVRALRTLLELMIESGLLTRDEYLAKLHRAPE